MAEQLPLFDAPKRNPRPNSPELACPRHAKGYICTECADDPDTDGYGFIHPSRCGDLIPVRTCPQCHIPVTRERWDSSAAACNYAGCQEARSGTR